MKRPGRRDFSKKPNENYIVRIRNKAVRDLLDTVAIECNVSFQLVFEVWCDIVEEGHAFGRDTGIRLTRRVMERLEDYE